MRSNPEERRADTYDQVDMDNPAASFTEDDYRGPDAAPTTGQSRIGMPNGTVTSHPNAASDQQQQPPPQQHYRRNASTYSIDIPATMGLMANSGVNTNANGGSSTSST